MHIHSIYKKTPLLSIGEIWSKSQSYCKRIYIAHGRCLLSYISTVQICHIYRDSDLDAKNSDNNTIHITRFMR